MGAVVYPERAAPLNQAAPDEMLLFATMEAVHTKDVYTSRALGQLLDERGLHVGHTYLFNQLPYIAGIFDHSSQSLQLSAEWVGFLDALSEVARHGRLWNPTVSDLVQYMRDLQRVVVVPSFEQTTVQVTNLLPRALKDVTVLLPRLTSPATVRWGEEPAKGWRCWNNWLAVWGDLPADGGVRVGWDSGQQQSGVEHSAAGLST